MIYESLLKRLRTKRSANKKGSANITALEVHMHRWHAVKIFQFLFGLCSITCFHSSENPLGAT